VTGNADGAHLEVGDAAVREMAGTSCRLPSGPLHDAAEVCRAGVPTIMLFVQCREARLPRGDELLLKAAAAFYGSAAFRQAVQDNSVPGGPPPTIWPLQVLNKE
jgi:hypothetical protein